MDELRKHVWEGMLSADKCVRYYDALAGRFYRRDLSTKIFLAIMSSGSVAGWAIWNDPQQFPLFTVFWKLLSGISAILAVSLPILNDAKKVEVAGQLKADFIEIQKEYELLWARVDDETSEEVQIELRRIWQKEAKVNALESALPGTDKCLSRSCQQEVLHARGLMKGTKNE